MGKRLVVAVAAATVLGGVVGCSGSVPPAQSSGAFPAGTAQVTVGGQDPGISHAVDCSTIESVTTISVGDGAAGTTSAVDKAEEPKALFVKIRNLGGFIGAYWQGVAGKAEVEMKGRVYTISGTATGFDTANPSFRAAKNFEIMVAC